MVKLELGIGEKVGSFLHYMSLAISGIVVGFIEGWQVCGFA